MENIKRAVELAKNYASEGDHEYAHGYEKDAWEHALEAIANGAPNASEIAKLALTTREIDFVRWFA